MGGHTDMIFYKEFDYAQIKDRSDLRFSPYIAALDIQFAHRAPYLWTFKLDGIDDVAYGRTWDDLIDYLETLRDRMHLNNRHVGGKDRGHYLVVIVADLSNFFGNSKKVLPYDREPMIARSGSDILLASMFGCYLLHSYVEYNETELEKDMLHNAGIVLPEIQSEQLSASCKLSEDELEASADRVRYMTHFFRDELNLKYQGETDILPITYTARVERLMTKEMSRQSNKSNCNLRAQIMKKNPISSEKGREYFLPLMYKAFFGGTVFYEDGVPDKAFDDVWSVDMTSAYIARMILSRYPIGEFKELPQPRSYRDLLERPYSCYAMLITFEVESVEVRPAGLPFLPNTIRAAWTDTNDKKEVTALLKRLGHSRIRSADTLKMTLTDIDFRLFLQNYKAKRIRLINILGSRYGYLPDYITKTIVQLYAAKAKAKIQKEELERLGIVPLDVELEYNRIKSAPARLYGIFTKKPIMERYEFDTEKKELRIADPYYISPSAKFRPVLYQWGVWTTALVRKEISDLRQQLLSLPADRKVRVLSGDTDNINYQGDAMDIISRYNDNVKAKIDAAAQSMGISPDDLRDLGSLTVKKYKKYKLTAHKQYCYIRETPDGDVFEYKVGGMNKKCDYFNREYHTPLQRFNAFGLGCVIPREYKPRIVRVPINQMYHDTWTDRDGNRCESYSESFVQEIATRFAIMPALDPSPLGNKMQPEGTRVTVEECEWLARKVANPMFNPVNYYHRKYT